MTASAIARPAAGTTITIPVTADHIRDGQPCRADGCPIALALFDAIPAAAQVDVWPCNDQGGYGRAHVITGDASLMLRFGTDAVIFIYRFDAEVPVEPATFTAEVIA